MRKAPHKISGARWMMLAYLIAIVLLGWLLMLPVSLRPGVRLSFIDALFTAASAISVTGLTTVGTADTFNGFGTALLMIGFQLGGIGIMSLGSLYWLLLGQPIGLSQRKLIMIDQNRNNLAGLVHLMKLILGMTLLFEGAGTLLFGVYFYAAGYADSFSQAFRYGLFHSVSAYTNAGFDLFGNSLQNYADDYFVQGLSMVLMILGAIGFPVLAELREYIRLGRGKFRFSLYTKVTTATYGLLLIAGAAGIWLTENRSFFATLDWQHKLSYALFASVTARSAGLTTFDPAALSDAGKMVLSTLMFIGASPSSMGGGVRTTTIAVIVMMLVTFVRGGSEVRLFGRSLHQEDVIKSFAFFSTALALLLAGVWFICMAEPLGTSFAAILFEASSAFGTCGLSTGITGTLTPASKIALILLMYIGRIGMMLLLSSFRSGKPQPDWRYPAEKLIIG